LLSQAKKSSVVSPLDMGRYPIGGGGRVSPLIYSEKVFKLNNKIRDINQELVQCLIRSMPWPSTKLILCDNVS